MNSLRQDCLVHIGNDLLAGLVVALALIPEAIAFFIIAGVDPKVGLYASFCIATVFAFAGGRPGMISAATGAMALFSGLSAWTRLKVFAHPLVWAPETFHSPSRCDGVGPGHVAVPLRSRGQPGRHPGHRTSQGQRSSGRPGA